MYGIIESIIDHEYVSNYSGDQQYIYFVCSAIIIILLVVFIDMIRDIFRSFWR